MDPTVNSGVTVTLDTEYHKQEIHVWFVIAQNIMVNIVISLVFVKLKVYVIGV
jgi:hypothetical protein